MIIKQWQIFKERMECNIEYNYLIISILKNLTARPSGTIYLNNIINQ